MFIESIKIGCFGKLSKKEIDLKNGINVIEGSNESGKTTLSEFIKFVFYGLSNKQTDGEMSERKKYLSWKTDEASGSIVVNTGDGRYRIERSLTSNGTVYKDNVTVVDLATNSVLSGIKNPGEHFFGIPEEVFVSTVYIRQADGAYFKGESIGQAVENIFYSADESVNTTKAIKKLEDARVQIKHKKNTGRGMLDSLEKERDELSIRLAEARSANEEILQSEASLKNTVQSIEKNKKECENLSRLLRKGEIIQLLDKFDEKQEYQNNVDNYQNGKKEIIAATSFNGFFPDAEYEESLKKLKNELAYVNKSVDPAEKVPAEKDEKNDYYSEILEVMQTYGGRWGISDSIAAFRKKKKRNIAISVMFGLIALVMVGAGLFLGNKGGILSPILAIGGGVFVLVCIVMLIVSSKYNKLIGNIYYSFGVEDEDGLYDVIDEAEEWQEKEVRLSELAQYNRIKREEDKRVYDECISKAVLLLGKWGIVPENDKYESVVGCITDALSDIGEIKKNLDLYDKEIEKNRAIVSLIAGQLADYDESVLRTEYDSIEGDVQPGQTDDIKKRYDFTMIARETLISKQNELERKLAEQKARTDNPAEIESRLKAVNSRIDELSLKYGAYMLAIEKLTSAADSLRGRIAPELSETSGELMSGLTDGKYKDIGVSDKLALTYSFDEDGMTYTKEIDYVSSGTKDIAYVSLRLALAELFGKKGHSFPIVFDEAFARLDNGRLKNMLRLAKKYSEKGSQTVILTSQTREAEFIRSGEFGDEYNYITL